MESKPQFVVGDRCFSHYEMEWGTVKRLVSTITNSTHGVTGNPLPDTTWYEIEFDDGDHGLMDDAHGNWDIARIVPPHIAKRYGYGDDPRKEN